MGLDIYNFVHLLKELWNLLHPQLHLHLELIESLLVAHNFMALIIQNTSDTSDLLSTFLDPDDCGLSQFSHYFSDFCF